MNMDDMLKLGTKMGGSFSKSEVVEMEHAILWKLSWNLFPPTAFCFAHHMISLFPREVPKSPTRYILQELAKYMTELAVCVYSFVKFKVSSKSFASCLVAMERYVFNISVAALVFVRMFSPPSLWCESLDDDCKISYGAKAIFLDRILGSFGLRQDDEEIQILKRELKALLCHNTDLEGKTY